MEHLLLASSAEAAKVVLHNNTRFWPSSSNPVCYKLGSLKPSLRKRIVVSALKKDKKNRKEDRHSFVPKPDEATGPFPEAVLLKEKKVQEDGKVLPEFADDDEQKLFEALTLQLESDLDVDRMRHYEVVYLIHEDHKDQVENVNTKVQAFVREKKGRIWRFSDWGMRRLAYKIQKAKSAHYILMNFEVEAKWINDFKTLLDKDERVIRHLVMKQDKAETRECPPPPEFHSLRSDMVDEDDDEDDDDDDYEEEYDDEEEEEGDGDQTTAMHGDDSGGIFYVDGDEDDIKAAGSKDRMKQKMTSR